MLVELRRVRQGRPPTSSHKAWALGGEGATPWRLETERARRSEAWKQRRSRLHRNSALVGLNFGMEPQRQPAAGHADQREKEEAICEAAAYGLGEDLMPMGKLLR